MAMQEVPLQAIPVQIVSAVIAGQNCQISLWQRTRGLFVDINVNGEDVVNGIIARDAVPIICRDYVGFVGNLLFLDTQGRDDPEYTGLGSRYRLCYLNEEQYAFIQE